MTTPQSVVNDMVAAGVAPGAAGAWGVGSKWEVVTAGSLAPGDEPVDGDTVYDLASLTKPLATASLAMVLADQGLFNIDDPVRSVVREFSSPEVTFRDLLLHDSGLPAYMRLERDVPSRADTLARVLGCALERPPRSGPVYSCLGFIVLAEAMERLLGTPFDVACRTHLFGDRLTFGAALLPAAQTVSREPWRIRASEIHGRPSQEGRLTGEVHDPLAWFLAGVSGNAGLFGSVRGVAGYLQRLAAGSSPMRASTWREWLVSQHSHDRVLGWRRMAVPGWSTASVGHSGFTGTHIWVDPERSRFAVLLSNYVYHDRGRSALNLARARFVKACAEDRLTGTMS